jgi:hypothetical protein
MTEVDFQERIAVEFQTLTTMLNCRLDALDEIAASLDSIVCSLGAIASLSVAEEYEHQHRI